MCRTDVAPEVSLNTSAETSVLPVGEIPFNVSATWIAGPTLEKSTSMKVGALPYADAQVAAWSPRLPTPPPLGAFVVSMYDSFGDWMPKAWFSYRKWFMKGRYPEEIAVRVAFARLVGRSGRQEKSLGEVFS